MKTLASTLTAQVKESKLSKFIEESKRLYNKLPRNTTMMALMTAGCLMCAVKEYLLPGSPYVGILAMSTLLAGITTDAVYHIETTPQL